MFTQEQLTKLGFKFGKNGAHSARSLMIEELKVSSIRIKVIYLKQCLKSQEQAKVLSNKNLVLVVQLNGEIKSRFLII